jgi:hypothetical protein
MAETDTDALVEELEHFRNEREKIKNIVGQIGGTGSVRREKITTIVFIVAIMLVFMLDAARHLLGIDVPLPPLFSIGVGILLVSLKIIWMMQRQAKVEHFQFWILNSIEFRLNEISKQLRDLKKRPPE